MDPFDFHSSAHSWSFPMWHIQMWSLPSFLRTRSSSRSSVRSGSMEPLIFIKIKTQRGSLPESRSNTWKWSPNDKEACTCVFLAAAFFFLHNLSRGALMSTSWSYLTICDLSAGYKNSYSDWASPIGLLVFPLLSRFEILSCHFVNDRNDSSMTTFQKIIVLENE